MSNASLELGGDNWAAKDGNLLGYAVGDSSGKYVPREFTFTRGSNLAATRVDVNGLIEKGRENLLTYSNDFSQWVNINTTETGGQTGYDGSSDAWLLEGTATNGRIEKGVSSNTSVLTLSVYAKAGTTNIIRVRQANPNISVDYDLSDGSFVSAIGSGIIDHSITSVGNGWYRITITGQDTLVGVSFYPIGASGSSIYIQDAQLEQGLAATDYIETGASTVQAGLLENEPRIDYTGGTGSLLLEPSRTQLIPYTEYLSGLSLSGNPPTITQNYAVSPEGVQNAVRIQDTDATNYKIMQTQFSVTAGSTYTISVYVKKASSPISTYGGFYFDFDGGTRKTSNLIFDEYNGTLVNASGNAITSVIHPVIDEGDYWRFSATATDTGSNTLLRPTLRAGASANGTTLNLVTKDYTAYGFQCEQGSYPTSYIPNHSGGSVTRDKDTINEFTLPSSIEGDCTIFLDTRDFLASNQFIQFKATDGTLTYAFYSYSNHYDIYNGSAFIVDSSADATGKIALKQSGSSVKIFVNGQDKTKSGATANAIGIAKILVSQSSAQNNTAVLNQMLIFPTALSDAQCSALTVEGLKEEILTSYIAAVDTLEDGAEARLDTYLQNLEDLIV